MVVKFVINQCFFQYKSNGGADPPSKKVANLIYAIGSKMKPAIQKYVPILIKYVLSEKLDTEQRVTGI